MADIDLYKVVRCQHDRQKREDKNIGVEQHDPGIVLYEVIGCRVREVQARFDDGSAGVNQRGAGPDVGGAEKAR